MPPRTTPIINPLYSKSEKTKRPFNSSSSSHSYHHVIFFSVFCLLIGVSGTVFSLIYLSGHRSDVLFRCGQVHDAFRGEYLSAVRTRKTGGGDRTGSSVERHKFLGFVGVQTGYWSADRRQALRSTWFPSDPEGLLRLEQATGIAFRFVIGRSKDAKKKAELSEEVEKYKDFMLIDVEDEYAKLPYKTLAFFKAAYELFNADYYVKVDDDIYLRPDRLATLLAKTRTNPMTYIGCMKKGPVITDPRLKWYESQKRLIGNEYFLHGYGPIYVLSAQVVASLAKARPNSLRMFSNEDVTIGSWMLAMNVQHEDNRAICQTKCTPTSIAVWDLPKCSGLCNPVTRLKELHQNSLCSKSTTLPSSGSD